MLGNPQAPKTLGVFKRRVPFAFFLSWYNFFNEAPPGLFFIGNINRQYIRYGNGGGGCDEAMKQSCPVKWIGEGCTRTGEFHHHHQRWMSQHYAKNKIVVMAVHNYTMKQLNPCINRLTYG